MRPFSFNTDIEGSCLRVTVFGRIDREATEKLDRALAALDKAKIQRIAFDLTNVDDVDSDFLSYLKGLRSSFTDRKQVIVGHCNDFVRQALELIGWYSQISGLNRKVEIIKNPSLRRFVNEHFDSLISKQIALVAYANRDRELEGEDLANLMNLSAGRIKPHLISMVESGLLTKTESGGGDLYRFSDDPRLAVAFNQFIAALNDINQRRLIRMHLHQNWEMKKSRRGSRVTRAKISDRRA